MLTGIVIWELFTLGGDPYPNCDVSKVDDIQKHKTSLTQGKRPTRPAYSNDEIYNIMKTCWRYNKRKRPGFQSLKCQIARALKNVRDMHESDAEK